ncbi:MAG: ATP-binding protein [Gammaproteobacteria bacterium]
MSISATESLGITWQEELLLLLSRQATRIPAPILIGAGIIALMAADTVSPIYWVAWLALEIITVSLRRFYFPKLPTLNKMSINRRLTIMVLITAANSVTHGLSLFFFPFLSVTERTVHTLLLLIACVGSVVTTSGHRPMLIAYLVPILLPLSILWAITPQNDTVSWIGILMAIILILFGGVLFRHARDVFRLFSESFDIRSQQIELNKQLEVALDRAESASRAKTRFLASASHDLRQPIHAAALFSSALQRRPLDQESHEIAALMDQSLQALVLQLDTLLDISKLDAGVFKVNRTEVNICSLVNRIHQEVENLAAKKSLIFTASCDVNININTDTQLLERILRNLIDNAIKYTSQGTVMVSVESIGKQCCITVADSGRGIPDHAMDKIFEEFYQIDNPHRDRSQGLGLGLAIVKRMVDLLGYQLTFTSTLNQGTSFQLLINDVIPAPSLQEQTTKPENFDLHGLNILIVDDDQLVLAGMKALMTGMGCNVITADGTAAAVAAISDFTPDIVLADFRLKDSDDGINTIRSIEKLLPNVKSLLISGDTAPERLRQATREGIELLHKPILAEDLIAHINLLLGGSHGTDNREVRTLD